MHSATNATATPAKRHCIVGTAGHIDHGKSALVKALTGIDPDRLPEEKARGMTLVLGFAHVTLPAPDSGPPIQIGFVDVPGHERLIKTMVAGATGFDLALLVVAADDGVMPQTREHIDILTLLGIDAGMIALNKVDLVHSDRLIEVRRQISDLVHDTPLADWPVIECSVKSSVGVDALRELIARLAADRPRREAYGAFRLPIDRAFGIHGRGLVVTGTQLSGTVAPGAILEVMPEGLTCKVRQVHSYGAAVEQTSPGRRVALNLTGIDREAVHAGMELAAPGYLTPTRYVDARVRLVARRDKPLTTHARVRVSLAAREEMAVLVLLDRRSLAAGDAAPAQLRFDRPIVCTFGQRLIFRSENASITLGGGTILRPVSTRLRADQSDVLSALIDADSPDAARRVEAELRRVDFEAVTDLQLSGRTGVPVDQTAAIREHLVRLETLVALLPDQASNLRARIHRDAVESVQRRALAFIQRFHATQPRDPGLLRDRLVHWIDRRARPGLGRLLLARLETSGQLLSRGPYVVHHAFRPALSAEDADMLEKVFAEIAAARFDPPDWAALKSLAGLSKQRIIHLEELARADPRLIRLAPDRYIDATVIEELKSTLRQLGRARRFKLAEVRDRLQLSRRVVQALLEHLDRVGYTRRVGDERILTEAST